MAGNHDYIGTQSFYKDFEWADNVVFFRKNHISYVYIASLNLVVLWHELRQAGDYRGDV